MDPNNCTHLLLLTKELARTCMDKSLRVVTAESCTGGGVAYELTSIPGSSQWFERGFVTYSDLSKIELLGVQEATIENHGAVSQEVVSEMAEGAIRNSGADISLAITGIAGPEGGNAEKPVGTCWFGWSSAKLGTHCKHKIFVGDRPLIRSQAMVFSLKELIYLIKINY